MVPDAVGVHSRSSDHAWKFLLLFIGTGNSQGITVADFTLVAPPPGGCYRALLALLPVDADWLLLLPKVTLLLFSARGTFGSRHSIEVRTCRASYGTSSCAHSATLKPTTY